MVSASATNVELPDVVPAEVVPPGPPRRRRAGRRLRTTSRSVSPRTIAIVHDDSEYGKGLADIVRPRPPRTDLEIVTTEAIDPESEDFSAAVNTVKAANVDAVFFGGYYEEAGQLIKQLADAGVEAPVRHRRRLPRRQVHRGRRRRRRGRDHQLPVHLSPSSAEDPGDAFADRVQEVNGAVPATYSAEGYDAANILLKASSRGKTDRESSSSTTSRPTRAGVSKQIKFDDNGNIEAQVIFLFEVKDGKIVSGDVKPPTTCRSGDRTHRADEGRPVGAPARRSGDHASTSTSQPSATSSGRRPSTG